MHKRLVFIGLAGVVAVFGVGRADGQDWGYPYYPNWCGYGYAGVYAAQSVPYFALYPPVYYSYRVARTYGYSPFAYPPGMLTPGSEPPRAFVQNAYSPATDETQLQEAPQPLKIDNPFVEQSGGTGATSSRKPAGRRPQVVYPATMVVAK
jgi:hypothetical protein